MFNHVIHRYFAGLWEIPLTANLPYRQNKQKKAQLLCHMQAARDSEESLCHLVDCTTLLRLL